MVLSTTQSIEGHKIENYLGIVTGVAVSMPKASFSFNMKKYYESYGTRVDEIKEEAFQKLQENAIKLKANAVVGITIDIEASSTSGVIFVSLTGTAVKIVV
ncbi:YbjQ family protein [Seonamhaeicola maritimus]|uniref:YbjQ family protein n=1 Tax=Seonamhaeicola maritimus TaxID=2591822 RepID=A0A5C7GHZ8_9FLAO|nr:heavy metal-binding domain-containing protein [Seonamhaeicola maritimus]TXG37202.1 YbjQ family protein [Seonamhaeicola maritimus]